MKMSSEDSVVWNVSYKTLLSFLPLAVDDDEQSIYSIGSTDKALTVVILNSTTGAAQSQK